MSMIRFVETCLTWSEYHSDSLLLQINERLTKHKKYDLDKYVHYNHCHVYKMYGFCHSILGAPRRKYSQLPS